ncbi:hypothetical protein NOV72_01565 [Caballeronia novacaledonica]|uniref:Uncharacterized protein n=2 Tax=Caballeronia novacaledonica TaxID=1544861 RepID=A0A2U3I2G8_9BURK|nr:hypothetical protein NOV72_01565 [Caballeronia novacaledonica]
MQITLHMRSRMNQRSFSPAMVSTILELGVMNDRGDRLTLDQRRASDLEEAIVEKRREHKRLEREIRDLERLRKKGPVTVVTQNELLITIYRNNRR